MLDSKGYLPERLDFTIVSYNAAFLNETKWGRPTHKTNGSGAVLSKVKTGKEREGAGDGEAAESPYSLAIAVPLGFPWDVPKEPWGSKEHSLKTTLPIRLEWQKRLFHHCLEEKQAKDNLNLEHWGLGFKRVCLKLSLRFQVILLIRKPPAFCLGLFLASLKSLLFCQTQTDPDHCHSSPAFS